MNWFIIALFSPVFWALSNHIDKYLISEFFKSKGIGALLIFSSIIGVVFLPFIFLFQGSAVFEIGFNNAFLIMSGGILYVFAVIPYLYAMQKDEASTVVPIFQVIPVFAYFLALIFLKEVLTVKQIFASLLIIFGAISISLDFSESKTRLKKDVLMLMLLSSLLYALNSFIFKFVAIEGNFWTTVFWEDVGFAIVTACFFLVKSYREQFFFVFGQNKVKILGINALNEVLTIVGKLVMNFAALLAPLALVLVINGFQPLFVFVFGIIITLFFPHLGKESLLKKHLLQKIVAILVMFAGVYLLNI